MNRPGRSGRLDSRIPVTVHGEATPAPDVTRNISPGGMCFRSPRPLEPGKVYRLELDLPDAERPLAVQARVVWIEPDRDTPGRDDAQLVGVEFLKIGLADQRRIYRHLESLSDDGR